VSGGDVEPRGRRGVLAVGLVTAALVVAGFAVVIRLATDDGAPAEDRASPVAVDLVRMMAESGVPVDGPPLIYFDFRPAAEGTPVTMSFATLDEGTIWLSITEEAALQQRDLELLRSFLDQDEIVSCGPATVGTDRVVHLDRIASVLHAAYGPCS
jgi:hypothetical protein